MKWLSSNGIPIKHANVVSGNRLGDSNGCKRNDLRTECFAVGSFPNWKSLVLLCDATPEPETCGQIFQFRRSLAEPHVRSKSYDLCVAYAMPQQALCWLKDGEFIHFRQITHSTRNRRQLTPQLVGSSARCRRWCMPSLQGSPCSSTHKRLKINLRFFVATREWQYNVNDLRRNGQFIRKFAYSSNRLVGRSISHSPSICKPKQCDDKKQNNVCFVVKIVRWRLLRLDIFS